MSDYANLRELYYEALQLIPEGAATSRDSKMSEGLKRDLEAYGQRNPDPPPEPALLRARNQAEWHNAQQNLVVAETPPEELAMAMGVSDGVAPSAQQGERMHEQRAQQAQERIETAKRDVEQMRSGAMPASGIGRSGTQPASTPGYVPAPVQGQVPPTHAEAHQQYAEAHRQAEQTHQASDNPRDAQAAAAHRQQADIHEMESHGTPNAPEAPATAADVDPQAAAKEQVARATQVTEPPPAKK